MENKSELAVNLAKDILFKMFDTGMIKSVGPGTDEKEVENVGKIFNDLTKTIHNTLAELK